MHARTQKLSLSKALSLLACNIAKNQSAHACQPVECWACMLEPRSLAFPEHSPDKRAYMQCFHVTFSALGAKKVQHNCNISLKISTVYPSSSYLVHQMFLVLLAFSSIIFQKENREGEGETDENRNVQCIA